MQYNPSGSLKASLVECVGTHEPGVGKIGNFSVLIDEGRSRGTYPLTLDEGAVLKAVGGGTFIGLRGSTLAYQVGESDDFRLFAVSDKYIPPGSKQEVAVPEEKASITSKDYWAPKITWSFWAPRFTRAYWRSKRQESKARKEIGSAKAQRKLHESPYQLIEIDDSVTMGALKGNGIDDALRESGQQLTDLQMDFDVSGELEERLEKAFEQQNS